MDYSKDARVDQYIDALPAWRQAICQQVRDLVPAADPDVAEVIKRSVQPLGEMFKAIIANNRAGVGGKSKAACNPATKG